MKHNLTDEQWEELSSMMLNSCRWLDDVMYPKGGWNGWTTSGMRMMTDDILMSIISKLREHERGVDEY
jgi:hypothetical protein